MATFREKFERALARDRAAGTEHRSDRVLSEMLARVGRPRPAKKAPAARVVVRRGVGLSKPKKTPVAPAKKAKPLLVSSSRRSWTPEQIAAALDDGVKRGKISGSAAASALRSIKPR